jgi:hypothetical protein
MQSRLHPRACCRAVALAAALLSSSFATAQVVAIDGGNSWNGWTYVADGQTAGAWVVGSTTRTFGIYGTSFLLQAGQTVGGVRIADGAVGNGTGYTGDGPASLFSGSWQVGDRIVGIGIAYSGTATGDTWFFHKDADGDNLVPASAVGAGDGMLSFNVGDTSSHITNVSNSPSSRARVRQYSIWYGYSPNGSPQSGNFNVPYGMAPTDAAPVRSFAVLAAGSTVNCTSIQHFVNVSAIQRANGGLTFGDGNFSQTTRFAFWEAGVGGFSQQSVAISARVVNQGLGCGASPLVLTAPTRPVQSTTAAPFELVTSNIPASASLHLGIVGLASPNQSLAVLGLPGDCSLHASLDVLSGMVANPGPSVSWSAFNIAALPPGFLGFEFFLQSATFTSEGIGPTTSLSNGLKCTVGIF